MTYILFVVFMATSKKAASLTAEFNTKEACDNAMRAIYAQADTKPSILLCVPKGK